MHGWIHCVADGVCDGRAHGGVAYLQTCSCGATREIEANGRHRVASAWRWPDGSRAVTDGY